ICGFNGVDKGTIVNAFTVNGFTTVEEVTSKTKSGNSCFKRKPLISQILQLTLVDDLVAAKPSGICGCT
ncbi:(2Fe-2S)-binding protein, partial [Staphylococcus aureus]